MRSRPLALLSIACFAASSGCAGAARITPGPTAARPHATAAVVLTADQLRGGATGLVNVLRGRLTGMQVRSAASACPEITLRGTGSMYGQNSPAVYVDGIRAADTCVLDMLPTSQVNRVEVYPMGVAPRPPYKAHPNGLILVFLEGGRG